MVGASIRVTKKILVQLISDKAAKDTNGDQIVPSIHGVGKTGQPHAKE